ncbi:Homogentisate 1,2-dioxygenase, partial [Grifola frondosa]
MLWKPFQLPSNKETVDFVDGLKTITGSGDPSSGEGIAIHIYTANASMGNKAFSNSDGDYLIVPQQGRLDIQTEVGKLVVEPGELVVIQRGHKFKADVEELFGSRFELPELGAIGANGLANPRDFQSPIAHFDIDQTPWEIIYKWVPALSCASRGAILTDTMSQKLRQDNHTPFDVVAWHGNYIPYKYDMRKFIHIGSISKDHIDPSVFTVLTAKSRTPGAPLAEFCVITARWDVASESFRPPFYHRNCAVEMLGVVYDDPAQPAMKPFEAGGFYYQTNMAPHGPAWEDFKAASEMKLEPMRVHEHSMRKSSFYRKLLDVTDRLMIRIQMLNLTDYAVNRSTTRAAFTTERFEALQPQFMKHIGEITATLKAKGLPPLDLSRAKL